jgi:NAD(P)-dependent dehydrogenase (short-subunit alcohol dehydrogenase family)
VDRVGKIRGLIAWSDVPTISDIAYGVLFLAADESRFVTGTDIIIDGGYSAQ